MKYRALVVGAGRIGAAFSWHDDKYSHAGAYRALPERVELVGFVESDEKRRTAAAYKWSVPAWAGIQYALEQLKPDIVSICVQPEQQQAVLDACRDVKAVWCEKPFVSKPLNGQAIQVNYMRRGDPIHCAMPDGGRLIVYGKDDIHTKCHFEDLAKFWKATLEYRPFNGPCAYVYLQGGKAYFFDKGGVDGGKCFQSMLKNLLDHLDFKTPLWSPPYVS